MKLNFPPLVVVERKMYSKENWKTWESETGKLSLLMISLKLHGMILSAVNCYFDKVSSISTNLNPI